MMRIASIIVLLGLLFPCTNFGQGETSNWYFGNQAGITFNDDGSVTSVTDGKLNTFEGCATISDSFGGLLFYTDGILVYNQEHEIMENGRGLLGDPSSTQSALIVPKPQDPNIFFIFTVDTSAFEGDPDRGLNYSIVDMSLNEGKGAVTDKNISLLVDCSEKIAAVVKDCSNQSVWLLTFASPNGDSAILNTFHAFEINTTGVVSTSVKTTFNQLRIEDPRGYLKIAPDGTKLANANARNGLFIYDFDAVTGTVSNQEQIAIAGILQAPYGIEFSPSGQYLYTHVSNDIFAETGHQSALLQYDIWSPNISGSQEVIDARPVFRGALQLGDNGKIYRTVADSYFQGSPFLSVINNPDQKGDAVDYVHEAISLNGRNSTQGLPPFIQSFFNKIALVKNTDGTKSSSISVCAGEQITLEADVIPDAIYIWEKDGQILPNLGNTLEIPLSTGNDSGKYRLTIQTTNLADCPIIGEALINVAPLPETNRLLLEQCDTDENILDGFIVFDLEQLANGENLEFVFYETLQDQQNENQIINPETYRNTQAFTQTLLYSVTNELGCSDTGEVELIINPASVVTNAANPILVCDNSSDDNILEGSFDLNTFRNEQFADMEVAFYSNLADATLEDNPLEGNFNSSNTTIYIRIESDNQCQTIETLDFIVNELPEIVLEDSYQVCTDGEELILEASSGYDSYSWYKTTNSQLEEIGQTQQIAIREGGTYRLEIGIVYSNNNKTVRCTSTKDFVVTESNRAIFEEVTIEDLTTNNSIGILVSGDGEYEFSLDGQIYQNTPLFENVAAGFYTVFARDMKGCGISEREIVVIGFPKFFTPNGDGTNDTWQLIGSGRDLVEGEITIFDRYGKLIRQLDADDQGWDGRFNGQMLPASDYWFRINLVNGREFKGHFSIKR